MTNLKKHIDKTLSTLEKNVENERVILEETLACLIMFNKRRSNEVAKITVKDWATRNKWKLNALKDQSQLDEIADKKCW